MENLLEGFKLSRCDTNIAFENISSELYVIDLNSSRAEHTPAFLKLDGMVREKLMVYLANPTNKGSRVKTITNRLMQLLGNMYPIPEVETEKFITRVLEGFSEEQFADYIKQEYSYTQRIREKIEKLSEEYAEKRFVELLDTDQVFIKAEFKFPGFITPGPVA